MITNRLLFLGTIALLFIACGTQKTTPPAKLETSIKDFMGQEFSSEKNSTNNLLLTWTVNNTNDTPVLKYAVWNIATGDKVYSGAAIRGKVSWLTEMTLELYDYPGIIDDNNPLYRYKIDLTTKTRTALGEKNEL